MHFARVLRAAGLPVGTDRIQLALRALQVAGLESRDDLRAALAACLVDRPEQVALFDQAFHIFWRDPDLLGRVMAMMLPRVVAQGGLPPPPENRRLADALFPGATSRPPESPPRHELEIHAEMTWSDREVLRRADFETMTNAEWQEAKRMVARLGGFFESLKTRRTRAAAHPGTLDWRATLRSEARAPGGAPRWREPRLRPAPLVVLADVSGSMSKYSRMLLHFAHALASSDLKVQSFVFGTRLTPISRQLRQRDADIAIAHVVDAVADWSGGTRISASLHEFNHAWSRRVLAQNATVVLISDGLEHGTTAALAFEMERLSKSCRRLVWLNPLLRYEQFEPRAAGIRAMLPWVDLFVPAHNVDSLAELAGLLASPVSRARHFPN
jgi:uncharacterized protein with von Willebrand factor type A (vWA) domain